MAKKSLTGFDAQNQKVVNVAAGSNPADAVNYAQLQSAIQGMTWKPSVRLRSTGNVNLAAPGASMDGVNFVVGDSFLDMTQTDATQNGIYVWNGASTPATRRSDANSSANFVDNTTVYVNEGTTWADTSWTCTNNGVITPGTSTIAFAQVGGGTAYSAGYGVTLNGTVFAIDKTVVSRGYAANVGDGSSTTITVQHNLGTLDVVIQLRDATTGEVIDADFGNGRTVNSVPLIFASAPAANAYRVVCLSIG